MSNRLTDLVTLLNSTSVETIPKLSESVADYIKYELSVSYEANLGFSKFFLQLMDYLFGNECTGGVSKIVTSSSWINVAKPSSHMNSLLQLVGPQSPLMNYFISSKRRDFEITLDALPLKDASLLRGTMFSSSISSASSDFVAQEFKNRCVEVRIIKAFTAFSTCTIAQVTTPASAEKSMNLMVDAYEYFLLCLFRYHTTVRSYNTATVASMTDLWNSSSYVQLLQRYLRFFLVEPPKGDSTGVSILHRRELVLHLAQEYFVNGTTIVRRNFETVVKLLTERLLSKTSEEQSGDTSAIELLNMIPIGL